MDADSGRQWRPSADVANHLQKVYAGNIDRAVDRLLSDDSNSHLMMIPETAGDVGLVGGIIQLHPLVKAAGDYKSKAITRAEAATIFKQHAPKVDAASRRVAGKPILANSSDVGEEAILDLVMAINDFVTADAQLTRLESVTPVKDAVDRKPDMTAGTTRIWFS